MATGDDATAAGMDVLTGNESANTIDTEINKSRDYIAQRTAAVTPVAKGGTGATSAVAARANLGVTAANLGITPSAAPGVVEPSKTVTYSAAGRIATNTPAAAGDAVNKAYADAPWNAPVAWMNSINIQGQLYALAATPATSGYTVAYLNSDGRLAKGASSERYKTDIALIDPASLGDIFPDLYSYRMAGGHDTPRVGWIAERLNESDTLRPFVVYERVTEYNAATDENTTRILTDDNGNPIPDSIDFIALLIAQNAQQAQQITQLAQRITDLEDRP